MSAMAQPIPIQWTEVYLAKLEINHFRLGNESRHWLRNFQENCLGWPDLRPIVNITPPGTHEFNARFKKIKTAFFESSLCRIATERASFIERS
jgi:hypothetical protein